MRTSRIVAAACLAGAGIFAWKWRQNYVFNQAHNRLRNEIPQDMAGPLNLLEHLDELSAFEDIADYTCMAPCCYTPVDDDFEYLDQIDPDED